MDRCVRGARGPGARPGAQSPGPPAGRERTECPTGTELEHIQVTWYWYVSRSDSIVHFVYLSLGENKKSNKMAAASVTAIRNKINENHNKQGKNRVSIELFEKLPPADSREMDLEIGMLVIG